MNSNNKKVAIVTGGKKYWKSNMYRVSKINFNILIHANTDKIGAEETKTFVDDYNVNSRIIYWRFNR